MHDHWLTRLHHCKLDAQSSGGVQCSALLHEMTPVESSERNSIGEQNEWQFLYHANRLVGALGASFQSAFQALAAAKAYVEEALGFRCQNDAMRECAASDSVQGLVKTQFAATLVGITENDDSKQNQKALCKVFHEVGELRKVAQETGNKQTQAKNVLQGFRDFPHFRALQEITDQKGIEIMSHTNLRDWLCVYEFLEVSDAETLVVNKLLRHFLAFGEEMYEKAEPDAKHASFKGASCQKNQIVADAVEFAKKWVDAKKANAPRKQRSERHSAHFAAIDFLSRSILRNFSGVSV